MKPRSTHSASKGLSLLESVIALALTLIVFGVVVVAMRTSGSTVSTGHAITAAQTSAESCCGLVRDQIKSSGMSGEGGLAVTSSGLQGPLVNDTVTYAQVASYDEADPLKVTWGERRTLRFEADDAEVPANGKDDDGDGLVDEGRVALYRVDTGTLITVLARDVAAFSVVLDPGAAAGGLPKVTISVTVQRELDAASDATSRAHTSYTATRVVTLLN